MNDAKQFVVSHAPFWHNGSSIAHRNLHTIAAAIPAVFLGIFRYGPPALAVVTLSVSSAMLWSLLMDRLVKRRVTLSDHSAALIGLLLAMLLPATAPWWLVLTGTFLAVVIGRQIFGGIGGNVFNPVAVALAMLMISWKNVMDFNEALRFYDTGFEMIYPLFALKNFGVQAVSGFSPWHLFLGQQSGGIGAAFGWALSLGGIYLMVRGIIRWEIALSYIVGVYLTASVFQAADAARYAGPFFHLLTGYTLMGALFLATEDTSSPVNFVPMLLYGFCGGLITVLIRNIGAYPDGTIYAVLVVNSMNPLLDKIRPKAIGKVL